MYLTALRIFNMIFFYSKQSAFLMRFVVFDNLYKTRQAVKIFEDKGSLSKNKFLILLITQVMLLSILKEPLYFLFLA
jgi:hypothetical protein